MFVNNFLSNLNMTRLASRLNHFTLVYVDLISFQGLRDTIQV